MKFRLIKEVEGEVLCYGIPAKTGEVVDLPDHLAEKALKCPKDYELVKDSTEVPNDIRVKRKYTRRSKDGDETGNP